MKAEQQGKIRNAKCIAAMTNEESDSSKTDADLVKFTQLLDAIVISPVGEAILRGENSRVRRKKYLEITSLQADSPPVAQSNDVHEPEEAEIEALAHLPGLCESVVLEKLDRRGRLIDGLTKAEVEKTADETYLCYLKGVEAGKDYAGHSLHNVRTLMNARAVPIGTALAKALGVENEVKRQGVDGTAWLGGFWAGAQRAARTEAN